MKRFLVLLAMSLFVVPAMAFHSKESDPDSKCDSCHIPHRAQQMTDMPLWSGRATSQVSWTKYSSETMDSVPGDPEGPTMLCLSCHDATDGKNYMINTIGGDLSGSHPIEMPYAAASSLDPQLHHADSPSNVVNGRGTIREDLLSATKGHVNCQSCHDIHIQGLSGQTIQWENPSQTPGSGQFELKIPYLVNIPGIRFTMTRSAQLGGLNYLPSSYVLNYGALCKTCHIK